MSGLVAVAFGVALLLFVTPAFAGRFWRMIHVTIAACFIFWYWLPGANLLTVQYVGVSFFQITASVDEAAWLVLASEIAVIAALLLLRVALRGHPPERPLPARAFGFLGSVAFASGAVFLVVRFAAEGSGVLVELASGLLSARAVTDYSNLSTGAAQSLLALWELLTINIALIALARHRFMRTLASADGALAVGALAVMFVASGTRAVLLQAIFILIVTMIVRSRAERTERTFNGGRLLAFVAISFGAFGLMASAFMSRFSLDAAYAAAGPGAVILDTLFSNNDMMREFAFVLDTMQPSAAGAADFLLTPFAFLLPSFLGFVKELPYHLLAYNQARLGLDLYTGEGNVFPGVIADFWLLFGAWGGPALALFVAATTVVFDRLRRVARVATDGDAYLAASLSYLFFGFRNIPGSFVLILVTGAGLIFLLGLYARSRPGSAQSGASLNPI